MIYTYQDHVRFDLGLGDPNRSACILAGGFSVISGGWILGPNSWRSGWRESIWVGVVLILGSLLLATYSRGGLVAAVTGLGVIFGARPKITPVTGWWLGGISVLLLGLFIGSAGAQRWGEIGQGDRSAWNRVELWRAVPKMMVEAPAGWGVGQAGNSYRQFYQEPGRKERYRTMVGTHATWLVERGWTERVVYVLGWAGAEAWLWPQRMRPLTFLPLATGSSFFVAGLFSSVAESFWVWVLPGTAFLMMSEARVRLDFWPRLRLVALLGSLALGGLGGLIWAGSMNPGCPSVVKMGRVVQLGMRPPQIWFISPRDSFFVQPFGHVLRTMLANAPAATGVGVVSCLTDLPEEAQGTVVLCGNVPEWSGLGSEPRHDGSAWRRLENFRRVLMVRPLAGAEAHPLAVIPEVVTLDQPWTASSLDQWLFPR